MPDISVTRPNTLATFMKTATTLKISTNVLSDLIAELDRLVIKITKTTTTLATADDRKTIMPADLEKALEDILRKKHLSVAEIVEQVEPLSIIELKELSTQIKKKAEDVRNRRTNQRPRRKR